MESTLEKTNKMIGLVSNTSEICHCGEKLKLQDISIHNYQNRVVLACPSVKEGIHKTVIIEEKIKPVKLEPRSIMSQDMINSEATSE